MKLTFNKQELLLTMRKNMEKHEEIYLEAITGYREQAIAYFDEQLKAAIAGKPIPYYHSFTKPENHIKDYQRVIAMFERSTDEQITLDESQFAEYILDDWGWKRSFLSSNSLYSASAITALKKSEDGDE